MKADCVMSSSSAMRTRCRYWSAVSPTLTMMSWPGLLMGYLPWNKKARAEAPAKALDPEETTGGWSSGREKVGSMSGGLFDWAVCATQVSPIDIGAQVFAADGACGCALNFRAALSRNRSVKTQPLRGQRGVNAKRSRQLGTASCDLDCPTDGLIYIAHAGHTSDAIKSSQ